MNTVVLGPPGAGKGTQAERVSSMYGLPRVATGDIFRTALAEGTPLGLAAKKYMDAGELVPDDVVEGIVIDRLRKDDAQEGFILDGFPRSLHQARKLDEYLSGKGKELNLVLNIIVEPEVLVERLTGRRVCRGCGANYHEKFNAPAREGVCDKCNKELYQREDDNEETVRNRLEVYKKQTEPLIEYYRPAGRIADIDGAPEPDQVFSDILSVIEEALARH